MTGRFHRARGRAPVSRAGRLCAGLLGLAAVLLVGASAPAEAQQRAQPTARALEQGRAAPGATPNAEAAAGEQAEAAPRPSKTGAAVFWLFALLVIGGAIFVITRSNLIAAVMGMVGTFFAIAVVYVMLYAHFLAAIQVLVYAGAIMVLFVFVIMILNRPEDEPWARQALAGKILVVLASLYLLYAMFGVLKGVKPEQAAKGEIPGDVVLLPEYVTKDGDIVAEQTAQFGSSKAVGQTLFSDFLFPFEAVSLVLLIAVVGAIAVARPQDPDYVAGADDAKSPGDA